MVNSINEVNLFFFPQSIAVVGVSRTPRRIGHEVLASIVQSGFSGLIYPVNPRAKEILGQQTYADILDIPGKIDLVVHCLALEEVPSVMEKASNKGVRGIIVISGGGKELSGKGEKIENKIINKARKLGIRVIGPNCIGVACFTESSSFDTFFQSRQRMLRPRSGPLSFITQSGTYGAALLEKAAESGIGVSKFASFGNRVDIGELELLQYLAQDETTQIIGIYSEGFGDRGRKLVKFLSRLTRKKPVVMLKGARSPEGAKAAISHTGFFGGLEEITRSLIEYTGTILVSSFSELWNTMRVLAMQPPGGPRVALLSNGAGPMVNAIDLFRSRCPFLRLATLSEETINELKRTFPSFYIIGNPLDITGSATAEDFTKGLKILANDDNVDILLPWLVIQDTPFDPMSDKWIQALKKSVKPCILGAMGGPSTRQFSREIELKTGVPVVSTPEEWVTAARGLVIHNNNTTKS